MNHFSPPNHWLGDLLIRLSNNLPPFPGIESPGSERFGRRCRRSGGSGNGDFAPLLRRLRFSLPQQPHPRRPAAASRLQHPVESRSVDRHIVDDAAVFVFGRGGSGSLLLILFLRLQRRLPHRVAKQSQNSADDGGSKSGYGSSFIFFLFPLFIPLFPPSPTTTTASTIIPAISVSSSTAAAFSLSL